MAQCVRSDAGTGAKMRVIRYIALSGAMMALLLFGSGFAYVPAEADVVSGSGMLFPIASPVAAFSVGVVFILISLFGNRRFIKRNS